MTADEKSLCFTIERLESQKNETERENLKLRSQLDEQERNLVEHWKKFQDFRCSAERGEGDLKIAREEIVVLQSKIEDFDR